VDLLHARSALIFSPPPGRGRKSTTGRKELPQAYTPPIYERKCDLAYRHVYDAYSGEGKSIYSEAS